MKFFSEGGAPVYLPVNLSLIITDFLTFLEQRRPGWSLNSLKEFYEERC